MKNPHRQVRLISGTTQLQCNLPDHPSLKVGNHLTLKDHPEPEREWDITWVSKQVREKNTIKTHWNNNI